jgi:uncharacterized protein (DUF885 family)
MQKMETALLDRRTFLASSTALGFLALGGHASAAAFQAAPANDGNARDAELDGILDAWFREDLIDNPTFATNLGLDVGELARLRGKLGESSLAEVEEDRARSVERLRRLEAFGRTGLTEAGELNYDIAQFRWSVNAQGARFRYGSAGGRPAPYVLTQLGGSYYGVPDFLDTQHPIQNVQDAEYYLDRIEDFARNLAQETERLRHDVALGVVPPDFILDKTIASLTRLREGPAAESTLVRSLVRRTGEANIAGDWEARAAALVSGPVAAGLDGQIALLRELRTNAVHDAGVWRLPEGEAYYDWGIRANTTTTMTGEEIHRTGLEQVASLHAELDTLLRANGYTQGSVGDRLNAMNEEERFLYPNTDPGRAELLAALNRQVEQITPLLPRMFNRIPNARVEIRRVPVEIEIGAPGGYYQGASLDGSRPGAYYINLRDTHERPSLGLPTLSYHEAVPGHHFQISLAREAGELPLYRRTQGFSAYNEGWALYAERVADELGVYEDDAFGKIGYLQSYLFRAVRLVVDSGMHHQRWSREQAVRYMMENAAEPEGSAVREIERYCVWPGQACAYKIGQTVIANLRAEAERAMGPRFDIKAFHDVVLMGGSMPLTVLERRVRSWMGA